MKQLVLSGNRVIAHGEGGFFSAGGAVICPDTGRIFENATVVNVECELPSNIDEVGYEYHAGTFVPCAPYGKGGGNIAVLCPNDCKSIKDSGVKISDLGHYEVIEYVGTGSRYCSLTSNLTPEFVVIFGTDYTSNFDIQNRTGAIITPTWGVSFYLPNNEIEASPYILATSTNGKTINWNATAISMSSVSIEAVAMNVNNKIYKAYVFGRADKT